MAIKVDTRGKLCPLPLILFRKAVNEHTEDEQFEILTDNKISCANLLDFIHQQGYTYTETEVDTNTTLIKVTVSGNVGPKQEEKMGNAAPREAKDIRVLQLRSNVMGDGDEKLGELLILAYLNTVKELEELPTHIICYNSGVKLATKQHEASKALLALQEKGVEVMVCGTCVNYYNLMDDLALGKVSNMFTIAELLQSADHIVTP